jgi:hypothetical protein
VLPTKAEMAATQASQILACFTDVSSIVVAGIVDRRVAVIVATAGGGPTEEQPQRSLT